MGDGEAIFMTQPVPNRAALFDNRSLVRLLIPLCVEQFLVVFIGMADTVMVSGLGEAAVSAVSLVDNINVLMNQVFAALATGGSVIAAQYLGKGDRGNACASAKQLYTAMVGSGLLVGLIVGLLHGQVLHLVFGELDAEVWSYAVTYFIVSCVSYPFMGAYSAGAAMYRAMGNAKMTMIVSLMMGVIKVVVNAAAIYGLHLGVMGAGLSTLVARGVAALVITIWIRHPSNLIFIHDFRRLEWRSDLIKRILHIGVPSGIENGLFQIGKLLTLSLVTGLGLASIASNAIVGSITGLFLLPGNAVSMALVTVVGQCMGAGQADRAQKLTIKLILACSVALLISQVLMVLVRFPMMSLYNLSPEATAISEGLIWSMVPCTVLFWALSFSLPNTLRAAGDVKYTMLVSMGSMWIFRVGLSYVFVKLMNQGVQGVWNAMYIDWIVRAAWFTVRFARGKWKALRVI